MPVDTSFYPRPAKPMNPLTTLQNVMGLQQQAGQNRLMQAQIGLGGAYAGAVDPNSGMVDTNKLLATVAGNPALAPAMPLAISQANELNQPMTMTDPTGRQQYITRQELQGRLRPNLMPEDVEKAYDHVTTMDGAITGLLNKKDLSFGDVARTTGDLVAGGYLTKEDGAKMLMGLPSAQDGQLPSSDQLRGWLVEQHEAMKPIHAAFAELHPRGVAQTAPAAAQPVFATAAPGQIEAATTAATGSADALNTLRTQNSGSALRVYQLEQALDSLNEIRAQGGETGGGTQTMQVVRSFLTAQTPEMLKKAGIGPDEVLTASRDKLDKYLVQYALGQAQQLGQGTDSKIATAISGNPNSSMSSLATDQLLKSAIGLEKATQAQAAAFDATGQAPENFSKFQTQWNKDVDPRAFIVNEMDQKERAKLVKSMDKTERTRFFNSMRLAIDLGFAGRVLDGAPKPAGQQ